MGLIGRQLQPQLQPGSKRGALSGESLPWSSTGAAFGIRTRDLRITSALLWPTELRRHIRQLTHYRSPSVRERHSPPTPPLMLIAAVQGLRRDSPAPPRRLQFWSHGSLCPAGRGR